MSSNSTSSSTTDPAAAAALAALVDLIVAAYRALFIGFVFATVLYGIIVLQAFFYLRSYSKDPWWLKSMTLLLFSISTVETGLLSKLLHFYLIQNLFNPLSALSIPILFRVEHILLVFTLLPIHLYYTYQIWKLRRSRIPAFVTLFLAIISFGFSLASAIRLLIDANPFAAQVSVVFNISGFVEVIRAVTDLSIFISLTWELRKGMACLRRTESVRDKLMDYFIRRGLLFTLVQIAFPVLWYVQNSKQLWTPFHQIVGKLCLNSYLAVLNLRPEDNNLTLPPIEESMQFKKVESKNGHRDLDTSFVDESGEIKGDIIGSKGYSGDTLHASHPGRLGSRDDDTEE